MSSEIVVNTKRPVSYVMLRLCPVQFFPYILLLVAVLMYTPALFWRFSAAPLLQSDLGFIMEELDRCYNRAVTLAKRLSTSGCLSAERLCCMTYNDI